MSRKAAQEALDAAMRHHAAGRTAEAEPLYRRVLERDGENALALRGLALIAHQGGDNAAAADLLGRAVARDPFTPHFWFEFGVVLRQLGRLAEAEEAFRKAINLRPDDPQALEDLRQTFKQQGRPEAAVEYFRQYVTKHPARPAGHNALGQSLLAAGRNDEGIDALRACLRLQPSHANAFRSIADAMIYQGRYAEAAEFAKATAQASPGRADAWAYLGKALQRLKKADAAVKCLGRAIALDPKLASAHNFLGVALRDQDRFDDAVAAFHESVRLRPDYADAYSNLGLAHSYAGQPVEALVAYRKAMEVEPDYAEVHGPYLMALNRVDDVGPREVFEAYRTWARRYADPLTPDERPAFANDTDPNRRLRVGYLSPDFRGHSVAYFVEPILASHDRARFDVVCYANVKSEDAVTRRLRDYGHAWRDVVRMTDAQVVDLVREDGIDILVDLAGHTTDNRLLVLARRAAPVQVTYCGYPNTTGMRAVDYRITDAIADPPGMTDHLYTEQLVRLSGGFLCYRPPDDAPPPERLDSSAAPAFTFGSFNSFAKVTPAVLDLWARVLAASPGARLLIKSQGAEGDVPRRQVAAAMVAHGVDAAARVTLMGKRASAAEHLEAYRGVDVALDTFAYNGTTTTFEALWMGVPVITLAGRTHAGRVGASLLSAAGLGEFVAGSPDEYVRLAAALCADPSRIASLRTTMRDRLRRCPLLDAARFTAELEDAYRAMWRTWCGER